MENVWMTRFDLWIDSRRGPCPISGLALPRLDWRSLASAFPFPLFSHACCMYVPMWFSCFADKKRGRTAQREEKKREVAKRWHLVMMPLQLALLFFLQHTTNPSFTLLYYPSLPGVGYKAKLNDSGYCLQVEGGRKRKDDDGKQSIPRPPAPYHHLLWPVVILSGFPPLQQRPMHHHHSILLLVLLLFLLFFLSTEASHSLRGGGGGDENHHHEEEEEEGKCIS